MGPPGRPRPGLLPARRPFTEHSEWNECGAAVLDARGNQMIRPDGTPHPYPAPKV
jgi:hypothetical protein